MFDAGSAFNDSLGLGEIQLEQPAGHPHAAHIAAQITNVENETWVISVDIAILILTTIGALIILGNTARNELRGRGSTTRMRLVQSLIISDLMMGITGLVGCIQQLSGHPLVNNSAECDGLGVTFVAIVFSQHLWTLALAFTTFMILLHPLSAVTIVLEKHWAWSWLLVWSVSFAVSVIGYVLYGYGPTGGICYYQDDSGLFGELIQFLPRGVVFVVIALLYGKLYVFLKRPDKIRTGFSHDSGSSWSRGRGSGWLGSRGRSRSRERSRRPRIFTKTTKTVIVDEHHSSLTGGSLEKAPSRGDSRSAPPERPRPHLHLPHLPQFHARRPAPADDGVPPWEKVELPPFQVDGQRYGGYGGASERQGSLLGLIRRPASTPAVAAQQRVFSPPPALLSPTNTLLEENEDAPAPEQRREAPSAEFARAVSGASDGTTAVDLDSPARATFEPAPASDADTLAQGSSEILCPQPMLLPNPADSAVLDLEKGLVPVQSPGEMDDDPDLDLLAMLRSEAPPAASHHSSEYIQESMSSYLNRKTALLMLWFPLGYVLLFGVSTVRIIYDFVGNPPTGVRAMSRWMIFGQGLLNLVIYGAVELHTKRVVRRRVRRGTLNQPASAHSAGAGSGLPGLANFRWAARRSNTAQSQSQLRPDAVRSTDSRTGTASRPGNGKSPTVSFVDPEMSILQRLDEEQQTQTR